MNDIVREFIQQSEPYAVPAGVAVLVLVALTGLAIYLNRRSQNKHGLNPKTYRLLKRLGQKQLANIQWPDGLGYYFTIDRLILRHDGITLLMIKPYPGKIFCSENMDYWTQMLGHKSYRFKNPLYELETQISSVSIHVPDIPVNGFLFFDSQTEFPKGHPEQVIHIHNMPEDLLRNKKLKVKEKVQSAWKKLVSMSKEQPHQS